MSRMATGKEFQNLAYLIALKEKGVTETPGEGNTKRVIEYHSATDLHATADSVPWCSAFVNWCFKRAGAKGTNNAMARSWLLWGTKVVSPDVGDVVVFSRGNDGVSGHVGFVAKKPSALNPFISVLGGNQDDMVCIKSYARARVLGYRRLA